MTSPPTDHTAEQLAAIYARVPPVEGCRKGCADCCGPAPMARAEAARIASPIRLQPYGDDWLTPIKADCKTCQFSTSEGCAIYANRPLICRLFGAVDTPWLTCPHGASAAQLLSEDDATELLAAAAALAAGG